MSREEPAGVPETVLHYRIEGRLGLGEMGTVYLAWDERLARRVALKKAASGAAEEREEFRSGARAVAGLSHPSLVRIYDLVYTDDSDWIVMEYYENSHRLRTLLEDGPLDPVQAVPLAREIAEGLAAAHAREIVFLTLGTESVLVTATGHAKILDFGLARLLDPTLTENPIRESGSVEGALKLMAPEQALDRSVDHRADLFSLGTLLYEAVTGRSPFAGATDIQTLQRLCSRQQESARQVNDRVPEELSALIDRLLEKDPDDRPQSAAEVVKALRDIESSAEEASGTVSIELSQLHESAGFFDDGSKAEPTDSAQFISLKTLLITDLVGSTKLVEELGDRRAAEILARDDRLARDLMQRFQGREIDKTDGFLILFKRPVDAVRYALCYHQELAKVSRQVGVELKARVGIHLGEVILIENPPQDVLRGAKPIEVQGLAKPIAARAMGLAQGGQTLLTRAAFDLSRRAMEDREAGGPEPRWMSHGEYRFKGVEEGLQIFEVGIEGVSPLTPPADVEKAQRVVDHRAGEERQPLPRILAALAAFLLIALAVKTIFLPSGFSTVSAQTRPAVAVLGFKNLSGRPETAWLSTALSELFSTDLATGGELRLIPGESIARMKLELSLPDVDTLGAETLEAISKNLGTDYVLLGSYLPISVDEYPKFRLLMRLQDTREDNIVALSDSGTEAELYEIVSRTGKKLRERLGVGGLSAAQEEAVKATMSASPEANRLYSEGLEKLRAFDALAARDLLQQAVEAEPGFALAHAALSEAWRSLGFDRKALASAKSAFERAEGLPQEEILAIQGRFYEADSQWQTAVDTYRRLWDLLPDDVDYGLRLAEVQTSAGRGQDALATVAELRSLPAPAGDDPRIDLAEAAAAYSLADYEGVLAAADRAEQKGRALKAKILVAEALLFKGPGALLLGKNEEASAALEEARTILTEVGDRGKAAQALNSIAVLSKFEGDLTSAEDLYLEALSIHRQTGNRKETSRLLNNLAIVIQLKGDLATARSMLEEALAISREDGRRSMEADYLLVLAEVVLAQGDLQGARELAESSLSIYDEIGGREGSAWVYNALGMIAFAAGEVADARRMFAESLQICEEVGLKRVSGYALTGLGEVLLAAGDLTAAEKTLGDALAVRAELGERGTAAETQLIRARLLLEKGRPEEAEALIREAARELGREAKRDGEITANAILAQALLAQGKLDEARAVQKDTTQRALRSQNPAIRMSVDVTEARLLAAAGDHPRAKSKLETVLAESTELGLVGLALEARLALGEIEIASGDTVARARLETLAEDAGSQGFVLIAREAAAASG